MKVTPSVKRSLKPEVSGTSNKRKVKLTRKTGKEFTVDLKRVIEEGKTEEDVELQHDDQIYVPQRLINM